MPRYRVVMQRMLTEMFEIEAKDEKGAADKVLRDNLIPQKTSSPKEMANIIAVLEITL